MILGLHGTAGAGKDTAYRSIAQWATARGMRVRRDAFADRLKWSAARALGYEGTREECIALCDLLKQPGVHITIHGPDGVAAPPLSGRRYLQLYGTEAHREIFGEDFWISAVMDHYDPEELLVVTDVRFANEAQAVRDNGGEMYEITRRRSAIAESGHASEQPLSPELLDRTLVNDGDIPGFDRKVRQLVQETVTG